MGKKGADSDTERRAELLTTFSVRARFTTKEEKTKCVLDDISPQVSWGEFLCILGQSGSGKSTLMNILGCLDIPTYGSYQTGSWSAT